VGDTQVSVHGLVTLATRCEQHGASLRAVGAPSAGAGGEPSVAAVRVAHEEVHRASGRLSARMAATAAILARTAEGYASTDEGNASAIAAVRVHGVTAV
jgi:hypothetical protein